MSLLTALTQLPTPLHAEVNRLWDDFTAAAQRDGVPLPTDETVLADLARIWATSEFIAQSCIRFPALLAELLASGDLYRVYPPGHYHATLTERLAAATDDTELGLGLRQIRRREMVRIAWRDLTGQALLTETLGDLSDLADAATDSALTQLYAWECRRLGTPRDETGQAQQLIVLGMGKLGGRELNFSSDIDLIFIYPHKGETDGPRAFSNEEFFRRLSQKLIKALNEITVAGFVFRVDMRLRPFGDAGPLVMPANAFEDYYQTHGREWERYAMIKARPIAGDIAAGERLLQRLRPFVYRRYLDYGAFEALRNMKLMIAREVERKGLRRNIKLGPGGIREIEFIGQAFQLIYGGRETALRERRLLNVLDYLAASGRLAPDTVAALKDAYDFLRRTENRLQAYADQQTHNLPEQDTAKLKLAVAMGYADWREFVQVLMQHVACVSGQFEQIFALSQSEVGPTAAQTELAALWAGRLSDATTHTVLARLGFDDPARALAALSRLRDSFSNRALEQRGRERMDQLIPLLLPAVGTATPSAITLERIVVLLEAIARRSVYLALLIESPVALAQLVKLCAASVWIAQYLGRYPLLLDDLLNPAKLYHPLNRSELAVELNQALARSGDDSEQIIDDLRHFKQTNILRCAAADISEVLPVMKVSDYLTFLAEVLLEKTLTLGWQDLLPRFGQPQCRIDEQPYTPEFAIVAYGKLGGIELGYGSDLDLVFLHDSTGTAQQTTGPRVIDNPSFFAKLAQRLIHILTAHTAAGELYDIDMRLRPSGRAGLLVSSFDAFTEYQRHQAWTWEHQALVRARVVAGPAHLAERFATLRYEILTRHRDHATLRREVREMRERMRAELDSREPEMFHVKQGRGGIADIEFMVQYLILAHAPQYPALLTYTDNIRQLDGLETVGVLTSADATLLRDAYRALRRHGHLLKLADLPNRITDNELATERSAVAALWQRLMEH